MGQERFWLVKSEPDCFSIADLAKSPRQTTCWSGVRNYQARNFMRDMRPGDQVLFFHSSTTPPAVAGVAEVVRAAYPDTTALDPRDDHFDPKALTDNPIWEMVDLRLVEIFAEPIPLPELRRVPELKTMELLRQGSRLSVQPVKPAEFRAVLAMAIGNASAAKKPAAIKPAAAKKAVKPTTKPKATATATSTARSNKPLPRAGR